MPPRPPSGPRTSALAAAGRQYSQQQLRRFAEGDAGMAFKADLSGLWAIAEAVDDMVDYGVNPNTASERAWGF